MGEDKLKVQKRMRADVARLTKTLVKVTGELGKQRARVSALTKELKEKQARIDELKKKLDVQKVANEALRMRQIGCIHKSHAAGSATGNGLLEVQPDEEL